MSKGKLEKFALLKTMPHVFQCPSWHNPQLLNHQNEVVEMKGNWHSRLFKNDKPITLELGCGYGEYTMAMAERFPNRNFIGVDLKGSRIYTGAKYVMEQDLENAAFLRSQIALLPHFFAANEVDEIWLPFPDPQRKKCKYRKRLTSEFHLNIYRQFLKPGGILHLKTDSDLLYEFTLELIANNNLPQYVNYRYDFNETPQHELLRIKTRYEKLNLSNATAIKYLQFGLKS